MGGGWGAGSAPSPILMGGGWGEGSSSPVALWGPPGWPPLSGLGLRPRPSLPAGHAGELPSSGRRPLCLAALDISPAGHPGGGEKSGSAAPSRSSGRGLGEGRRGCYPGKTRSWSAGTSNAITTTTLATMPNGASVAGTSVTFEWGAVAGATDYKLIVNTTNNLYASGRKASLMVGNVTTYVDSGYLGNGTVYYWWVIAYASDGGHSDYNEVIDNGRSFTNGAGAAIGTPALVSPANGATVTGASVTFEWSASKGWFLDPTASDPLFFAPTTQFCDGEDVWITLLVIDASGASYSDVVSVHIRDLP